MSPSFVVERLALCSGLGVETGIFLFLLFHPPMCQEGPFRSLFDGECVRAVLVVFRGWSVADLRHLLRVCSTWRSPRSTLYSLLVSAAGFPFAEGKLAFDVWNVYWPLFLVSKFPRLPNPADRFTLFKQAQERISQGLVLFVQMTQQGVEETNLAPDLKLILQIQGGETKGTIHSVSARLFQGKMEMPSCDCVMSGAREANKWCSHMLMLILWIQRVRLHFEELEYGTAPRKLYDGEVKASFQSISHHSQVKLFERLLIGRLRKEAVHRQVFESSKLAYLESFGASGSVVSPYPTIVSSQGAFVAAREKPGGSSTVQEKKKRSGRASSKRRVADVDESEGQEDEAAAVPHKRREKLGNDVFKELDRAERHHGGKNRE